MKMTTDQAAEWMRYCYRGARFSPDRSTQNYAIVVSDDGLELFHKGSWNGLVKGQDPDDPKNHERPLKYVLTTHAEEGAILRCARQGLATDGAAMVCPWSPCSSCAGSIVEAGIKTLVVHEDIMEMTPDRWVEDVQLGFKIVTDAGVQVVMLSGPVDAGVKIRFDGKEIEC